MSVQTTLNRTDQTAGGAVTNFLFSFNVYTQTDLLVYTKQTGQSSVLQVLNGGGTYDYAQSAVNVPGSTVTGGSVTFNNAPPANTVITLIRKVAISQLTSWSNYDKNDAKSVYERSFDLAIMALQQHDETLGRSLTWPITVTTNPSPTLPDPSLAANQGLALGIAANGLSIITLAALPQSLVIPVPINQGGTNSNSALNNNRIIVSSAGKIVEAAALTANSFLYSGASGIPVTTAAPTNGQLLIGSTGVAPALASLTAGANITITPAAGAITIAVSGAVPGTLTAGTQLVQNPYVISSTVTQAHGLSAVSFVRTYLECLTAENGFSVGDRVEMPFAIVNAAGAHAYSVRSTGTNVILETSGNLPNFSAPTGHTYATITAANWKLVATPYKLN